MLTVPIKPGYLIRTAPQQGSRIGVVVRGPYADNSLDDCCDIWFGDVVLISGEFVIEKLIVRKEWFLIETPVGV